MAKSQQQFETVRLKVPISDADIADLKIGTIVYLDGVVYTAREGAYKRILEQGIALPDGIREISNVNFHCSPAASVRACSRSRSNSCRSCDRSSS